MTIHALAGMTVCMKGKHFRETEVEILRLTNVKRATHQYNAAWQRIIEDEGKSLAALRPLCHRSSTNRI